MDSSQAESLPLSLSKHPEVGWEEGKSTLAYEPGQFTPVYVATMKDKHQAGGQMRQVALAAGSLTIPLPSNSSCPLHQDRLKAPTGISFKNGSNSRGGWWKLEHADSMLAPRVARKINDGRILSAAHTGVIE